MSGALRKKGQVIFGAAWGIATVTASILGVYYTNQATLGKEIQRVELKVSNIAPIDARQDEAIATIKTELKDIKDLQLQILKEIRYGQ